MIDELKANENMDENEQQQLTESIQKLNMEKEFMNQMAMLRNQYDVFSGK
jgi:hypothetical protein